MNKEEKFKVLLSQLKMTDAFPAELEGCTLERLDISQKERQWFFHIKSPVIFPADVYMHFQNEMKQAFGHIATVDFQITAADQSDKLDKVQDYLHHCVEQTALSPNLKRQLKQKKYTFSGDVIRFIVNNEVEQQHLEKSCNGSLLKAFKKAGFHFDKIIFEIDDRDQQRELESLEATIRRKIQPVLSRHVNG